MQVRSKDSKHLFSLDNLLDFLHKKADITDCLKQHRSLWRIHDTCFYNEDEVRKKKHVEMGQRETKTVRKKQERGRNVGTSQCEPFHSNELHCTFSSGLLSAPVMTQQYLCATNLYLVIRVTGQQTLKRQFAIFLLHFFFFFFNSTGVYRGRWWMCVTGMSWIKEGADVW